MSETMPGRNGGTLRRGGDNRGAGGRPSNSFRELYAKVHDVHDIAAKLLAITTDLLDAMAVSRHNYELGGGMRTIRRARSRKTPVANSEMLTEPAFERPVRAPAGACAREP